MIAGADWCGGLGWVLAIDCADGGTRIDKVCDFSALVARSDLSLVVIDIPIGLLDTGRRLCDTEVRGAIGARRNSVFTAPIRHMLGATSYDDACNRRFCTEQKKCSKQLYGILHLIAGVDSVMRARPELQQRIREGHPEYSFTLMADGPMRSHKSKPDGRTQRRALLRQRFPDIDEQMAATNWAPQVDVHDAYALLWTARRILAGNESARPSEAQFDSKGLRMEIIG
jgi:predicted RNase H-like nuclease